MPRYQDLNWKGLEDFTEAQFLECLSVDRADWDAELLQIEELFMKLHTRLPAEMSAIRSLVGRRPVALTRALGDEPGPDLIRPGRAAAVYRSGVGS